MVDNVENEGLLAVQELSLCTVSQLTMDSKHIQQAEYGTFKIRSLIHILTNSLIHTHMHAHTYAHAHAHMHVRTHTHTHTHTHTPNTLHMRGAVYALCLVQGRQGTRLHNCGPRISLVAS